MPDMVRPMPEWMGEGDKGQINILKKRTSYIKAI
jgi:hypothetical protein